MRRRMGCERARTHHIVWTLARILGCLLIIAAFLALFGGCARISTGAQSTSRPTATAIPPPATAPTVRPTATPIPQPTATPTATVPRLAQAYDGTFHNTTINLSGTFTLTNIVQTSGEVRGMLNLPPGVCGTGPFTGTVGADGRISISAVGTDGCNTNLEGSIQPDRSLAGTATATGGIPFAQTGTWQAKPA